MNFGFRPRPVTRGSLAVPPTTTSRPIPSLFPPLSAWAPTVAAVLSAALVTGVAADLLRVPKHVRVLVARAVILRGRAVTRMDLRAVTLPSSEVPPGALTVWPHRMAALYAATSLVPGVPVTPAMLNPRRPNPVPRLGPGEVAVAVAVPTSTLPGALRPGTSVALAGTLVQGTAETLIAMHATVVDVSALAGSAGLAPSDEVTLSLPVAIALAAEAANRNGSLALLPWSLDAPQTLPTGGGAA